MLAVLKFGGSSVADTKKIQTIATYLKERTAKGEKLIVVVSAMGKTTDALLSMAQNLSNQNQQQYRCWQKGYCVCWATNH